MIISRDGIATYWTFKTIDIMGQYADRLKLQKQLADIESQLDIDENSSTTLAEAIADAIDAAIEAAIGEEGAITDAIDDAIGAAIGEDGAITAWADDRYAAKTP